ncbi:HU family DNA-binding protein [Piscirickettsia salmonis]|uniref:HU family DNA-binding protein n=1 Tax=Piscirickettsia salmonis TaxID=1238 RepID=UPI003EBD0084
MAATKRASAAKKKPVKKAIPKKAVAAKKTTAAKKKTPTLKAVKDKQTKSEIIIDLAEALNLERKDVKEFFTALKNQVERHVKKGGSGEITIPDLGVKLKRVKKPATKKRKGRNPMTGEEIMIKAKPARTVVKATALKALKEMA